MTNNFFQKVVDQTLKSTHAVLGKKNKEYGKNQNVLHNFEVGARMTGLTREKVLHGFALKHHISIADIRDGIENGELPTEEMLNEKFGDAINYLILEKASILERIEELEMQKELSK